MESDVPGLTHAVVFVGAGAGAGGGHCL